jgi:DNA repair photolyase
LRIALNDKSLSNEKHSLKVGLCSKRKIIQRCSLKGYAYQIDPYIGCEHHCYYCYALNRAETDWSKEILVYPDLITQLSSELAAFQPQPIYLGWNCDPYQPSEEFLQQTRMALEMLAQRGFSVCILTKSGLVTRDIDLITRMPDSSVGFSIAFQDEIIRQLFEANAPANEGKLIALKQLKASGVRTYTLICPVMPFITEVETLVEIVAPNSDTIWFYALSMEKETDRNWSFISQILDRHFPELTEKYRRIAFSSTHPYWSELHRKLEQLKLIKQLDLRIEL